jgi:hypothetical protein
MQLWMLGGLNEAKSFSTNEDCRTGDEQDGGRGSRVHPPVLDEPALAIRRRCDCRRRSRQSFQRSGRGRPHVGVLWGIRRTALSLTFSGHATFGHIERKSVATTRYVLNAAIAVATTIEGTAERRYMDRQIAFLDHGMRPNGLHDLVLTHELARPLQEEEENVSRSPSQRDGHL